MNRSTTLPLAPRVPHDQRKRSARLSWGVSLPPHLRPILLSALLLLPASLLPAQTPAQQTPPQQGPVLHTPPAKPEQAPAPATTTLSVDARLVNLPVVVRDKKGALIQTLTKDDFVLKVDEHPQAIRYFDLDSNLPLTLGLLVDTSESVRNVLDEERTASSSFLDTMLTAPPNRDPDKAFVIQFARQVELLQDLTPSRPLLKAAPPRHRQLRRRQPVRPQRLQ